MLEVGEQLLTLAQRQQNAAGIVAAHWTLGVFTFVRGALPSAHAHLEQECALANAQNFNVSALLQGYDAQVLGLCWGCLAYWLLGSPVQALQWGQEVLRRGRDTTDLHSRVYGLIYAARLHQYRREALAAYAPLSAFPDRPSRSPRPGTSEALPYPILRGMSRPR